MKATALRSLMTNYNGNIILAGFMGTGKTTIGRRLAQTLGWEFLDTDATIEEREGQNVSQIFKTRGEEHFRLSERMICREIALLRNTVVATGGGMLLDPENRRLLYSSGVVFRLSCPAPEILQRVGSSTKRPLIERDPVEQVSRLMQEREPVYASLPFQIDATGLNADTVSTRILRVMARGTDEIRFVPVSLAEGGGYTLAIGPGALDFLGDMISDRGLTARVAVVADENVARLHLGSVMTSLEGAGFQPFACTIPAGEQSKNPIQLEALYNCFLDNRLDRRGAVVALGGGVTGDLAGYAAATYMRGVTLIQCPTTLLAMVDSSVGGKTGIDLPQGKNLVGAFKQPLIVISDVETLKTLPDSEIRMGMAEVIKHGVIGDPDLFELLEASGSAILLDSDMIARGVGVKISVVEADPFEGGLREVLNLGHTVGHALEKCSRYTLGHGDAVAVGLLAVARISEQMGLCGGELADRLEALLIKVGLPVRHNASPEEVVQVMASDKKVVAGRVRFVLIRDIGKVEPGWKVEPEQLKGILESLKG
ncbi:MAG: 3-dehydroquinate synthase [Desulfomonile tiedjei]|nr:3-dehydroquinate synthase [Desulfomonile tiedjei]